MAEQNSMQSTLPTTPPGLEGLRTIAGGVVAPLVVGFQPPYVPPNQSTYGAGYAKSVNDSLYKELMSGVFQQMGQQIGHTLGALPFVQQGAQMAGYTPAQMRDALSGGLGGFGRSMLGSMVMPFVDTLLDRAGISGGGFVSAAQAAFTQRMALTAPQYVNPYDPMQQHQALAGASAMMQLVNGLVSDSRNGNSTLLPNMAFTQGFDRGTVANVMMQAAANGAFSRDGMNFFERMTKAAGGLDIGMLQYGAGDFTGGGDKSHLTKRHADNVMALTSEFSATAQEVMKAYGAMRDLLKRVDGLDAELAAVTGGQWNSSRAAARATHDALRRLDATATIHNIDTNDAFNLLKSNRALLQDAAGFGANMQYYGFDGGGMFSLPAQTELLSTIEDMITARGERGNPILAERRRRQGIQAFARGQNTMAGRAAMLLAYGRQVGIFSEDEAASLRDDLTSGDRGMMGDALNRLLVTEFGSGKRGREMMQDTMLMNGIMMRMTPEAGVYATQTIMRGASNEYMRREGMTMAENRLARSRDLLQEMGMNAIPSDTAVGGAVDAIAKALVSTQGGGERYASAFRAEVANWEKSGMGRYGALQAAIAAFKDSSVTGRFSDVIDLAYNKSMAAANESRFSTGGSQAMQAYAMSSELNRRGWLAGDKYADIIDLLNKNDGAAALAAVNGVVGGLDPDSQRLMEEVRTGAEKRFAEAQSGIAASDKAAEMQAFAASMGYGLDTAAGSYNSALTAARRYRTTRITSGGDLTKAEARFAEATRDFRAIWGDAAYNELKRATEHPADNPSYLENMGRVALEFEQGAVGTLGAFGYGSEMSGHFGGGRYAGNDPAKLQELKWATERVASAYTADALGSAENRNSVAQDLIKGMYDKDYLRVLRVYGGDDLYDRLGDAKYNSAFEAREKAAAAFNEAHGGLADAMRQFGLDLQGTAGAEGLSLVRQTMRDVGRVDANGKQMVSTDQVVADLMGAYKAAGKSWSPEMVDKFENALKAQSTLGQREFDVIEAARRFVGTDGNAEKMRVATVSRDLADEAKKKRMAIDYGFTKDIIYDSQSFKQDGKSTALGKSVDAIFASLGSDKWDKVAEELGVSGGFEGMRKLGLIGSPQMSRAIVRRGVLEATDGNAGAARALEQTRAALNEGKTQITGTLTLTDGESQTTGFVSGNINGLGK